jgi:tetraprenyl-beta-curcumene synthase
VGVGWALVAANARYWPTVAPRVHRHRRRLERRALAIAPGAERDLALAKLREEFFNAEVAATLATLAPRRHRAAAVQAIVALEVLYDYLDGLSEGPLEDPLGEGERLFDPFLAAVSKGHMPEGDRIDGGYGSELALAVQASLARLPGWDAVAGAAGEAAARCAQAQVRIHAIPQLGAAQAREWAQAHAAGTALGWREWLAGSASSVLAVHALIAAGANEQTTATDAEATAAAYLTIGAGVTLLDSLADHRADTATGERGFIALYEDPATLPDTLAAVVRRGANQARALPDGAHHVMTLAGVVAYWTSDPGASDALAAPAAARVQRELRPLIVPTLGVMRVWRAAKAARARCPGSSHSS